MADKAKGQFFVNTVRRFLRSFAAWMLANIHPTPTEIDAALVAAFRECGLPVDRYSGAFDIAAAGKLHDVLHHATHRLGQPVRTVDDLRRLLA